MRLALAIAATMVSCTVFAACSNNRAKELEAAVAAAAANPPAPVVTKKVTKIADVDPVIYEGGIHKFCDGANLVYTAKSTPYHSSDLSIEVVPDSKECLGQSR